MKVIHGRWRTAFLIFFITHIPITLLIDGQGAFGGGSAESSSSSSSSSFTIYPSFIRQIVVWYTNVFGDVLMKGPPSSVPWFVSIICCELLFQVPFFFIAIDMILKHPTAEADDDNEHDDDDNKHYPGWFKTLCLLYGSHVTTTLIPILATFMTSSDMSTLQKIMTITIYSPYLIFPVAILFFAATDDIIQAISYYTKNRHVPSHHQKVS